MRTVNNMILLWDRLETRKRHTLSVKGGLTRISLLSQHLLKALFDVWSIVVWIILVGKVLVIIENSLDLFRAHQVLIFGRQSECSISTLRLII